LSKRTSGEVQIYRTVSRGLLALVAVFILFTFKQHGISNDEEVQHVYGRLLLKFYESGFHDFSAFHYKNLYLYGGFFDLIAALLEKLGGLWLWDMRHLLSAAFGLLGLLATYRTATLLRTPRTGFIALLLLLITGAWSGAMFTHTKDIPFATCMMWALYYTIKTCRAGTAIPLKLSLKLGVAVGCALGMRIGAGFAVVYLLLSLTFTCFALAKDFKSWLKHMLDCCIFLLPAGMMAFLLMAIFWPWGVMSPTHPSEAIKAFSYFSFDMLTIDDGVVTSIGKVPRTYLLSYLGVRLPEVFLLGLLQIALIVGFHVRGVFRQLHTRIAATYAPIFIAVVFPLVFVLITKPALYNGVRHFTFVLPPLAALAAVGIDKTLDALIDYPKATFAYVSLCLVLAASTISQLAHLHPYEYIYYNHFAGDTAIAEKRWEGDYWSSGLREAAKTLTSMQLPHRDTPYQVAVCAEDIQGSAYLDNRFEVSKNWNAADFFMSTTNMNCDKVMQGKVIGEVKRLDTTITVVKDRRDLVGDDRIPRPAPN
jgi:hypothetical protein